MLIFRWTRCFFSNFLLKLPETNSWFTWKLDGLGDDYSFLFLFGAMFWPIFTGELLVLGGAQPWKRTQKSSCFSFELTRCFLKKAWCHLICFGGYVGWRGVEVMINILLMEERSWTKFYRVPGRMCGVVSSNPQCHRSPDRTWNPVSIYYITPPKFHIAPESHPPKSTVVFQPSCLRGWRCTTLSATHCLIFFIGWHIGKRIHKKTAKGVKVIFVW